MAVTVELDLIQTLALASVVHFIGSGVRRRVRALDAYNIPAPVVGGLLFAAVALALRRGGLLALELDTTLQAPLGGAFFTTIGLGASLALLRAGGPPLLVFWFLASALAVVQNGVGVAMAKVLHVHPYLGIIAGSITLTGGHGTGAAFGRMFEQQYAFSAAVTLAMAAATFGLVSGGLLGGPVATRLIRVHGLSSGETAAGTGSAGAAGGGAAGMENAAVAGDGTTGVPAFLRAFATVLVVMWLGSLLSGWLARFVTMSDFVGMMIVAACVRNFGDWTGWLRLYQPAVNGIGAVALSLFLAMALMSLRLWDLLDLAVPMLAILLVQVLVMAAFSYFITFRLMGRDYDAAVITAGHCGFGLGSTSSAVANMAALVEHFGPSPRAFLIVPIVGGFLVDFTNALITTASINLVR